MILLIEDDVTISTVVKCILETEYNIKIDQAYSLGQAIAKIMECQACQKTYEAIVCDLLLPDSDGIQTIRYVVNHCPEIPVIAITGGGETYEEVIRGGAQDYIEKPINYKELVKAIKHSIERHKVRSLFKPLDQEITEATGLAKELTNLVERNVPNEH